MITHSLTMLFRRGDDLNDTPVSAMQVVQALLGAGFDVESGDGFILVKHSDRKPVASCEEK